MALRKEYDVVVIGGGINGLTAAAYLQKAGLDVALFERREEVGTHCTTEEVLHPGAKLNLHASGILIGSSPAYLDLELEKFGLDMLCTEVSYFHPFKDKSAVIVHRWDLEKTIQSFANMNQEDADTFRRLFDYFRPLIPELTDLLWFTQPTPETWDKIVSMISKCPDMPTDWLDMTGIELMDLLYQDERFKTTWNSLAVGFGVFPPTIRTVGAFVPIMPFVLGGSGMPRGGSHALPHALIRCFIRHGGSAFQGCPVEKIIVENGIAKGVALSKYAIYPEAEVRAKRAVISDLTAYPTFIDLVGEDKLPRWVAKAAKNFDYNAEGLFTNYWVLNERHHWDGYPDDVQRAFSFMYGAENTSDIERLHSDVMAGRLSDPPIPLGLSVQGYVLADPSQAPAGQYTLMSWSVVPYDLRRLGGAHRWDDIREEYADKVEDLLASYGSNVKRAKIARYVQTPLDIYRRNPSAIKGCWSGGAMTVNQFYDNRPFPGCGAPRTPVDGLYISNSMWPNGQSYVPSGVIAAKVVAEDTGVREQPWWVHKGTQSAARVMERWQSDLKPRF